MREEVETILAPDGRERVTFYRPPDGHYEYSFDKFYVDDVPEYQHHMEYWAPVDFSGVYDRIATAKHEASAAHPWVARRTGA